MNPAALISLAGEQDMRAIRALLAHTDSPFEVEKELARPYGRLWVARIGGAPPSSDAVGFLLAWDVADELHVIDVIVGQAFRRQGLGRALLETLIAHGRARGARIVLLEVRASNAAAIGLYRSLGFEVVGERPKYYVDGEDALEMRLELNARAEPPLGT